MIVPMMRRPERWNRRDIEKAIEALIAELDRRDGDPDAEPSLGWLTNGGHSYGCGNVDLEVGIGPP